MPEILTKRIVEKMIMKEVIDIRQEEEYLYTVQLLIERCIGFAIIFLFALLAGKIIETVLFLLPYLTIRKYSGGYHCKTDLGCLVLSLIFVVISILLEAPMLMNYRFITNVVFIISIGFMLIIGPVNHPNMNWTRDEFFRCKRLFHITVLIWTILLVLGEAIGGNMSELIIYCQIGVINASFLMMTAKILKQEVKPYEKDDGQGIA